MIRSLTPAVPTLALPASGGAEVLSLTVPFRGKTLSVQIRSQGEPLQSRHLDKVVKHLNLAKEDLDVEADPAQKDDEE